MQTKNYIQPIIFSAVLLLAGSGVYASGNSNNLTLSAHRENIKLVTDRDIYVSGDYLQFHAWQQTNLPGDSASGIFYLTLNYSDLIVDSWIIPLENAIANGNIYLPDTLPTGEYYLTAHTNLMRNKGQDSCFTQPLFIANRFDNTLATLKDENDSLLSTDQQEHTDIYDENQTPGASILQLNLALPDTATKREPITLNLSWNTEELSLTQIHVRVVAEETLASKIMDVAGIGNSTDIQTLNTQNRLFPIEHNAKMVTGHIEPPLPASTSAWIIASTPDTVVSMLYTSATATSSFSMAIPFSWQNREVYLHLYPFSLAQNHRLVTDENAISISPSIVNMHQQIERKKVRFLQDIARARIAWKISQMDTLPEVTADVAQLPLLFSKPTRSILLSDFIPFDDLQDISREIIPQLRLRRDDQSQFEAILIDESTGIFLPDQAAVFIDGILTNGIEPLMHLNSSVLNRIDLHTTRWMHGPMEFQGILSLQSKNHEYLKIVSSADYFPAKFEFHHKDRDLISMERIRELPAETPDLRHVLFWGAPHETNSGEKTISFVTSDLPGKYIITVSGLNQNGELVTLNDCFVVK